MKHPELRYGDYKFHSVGKNVLAYERVYEKSRVLVLINPSAKEQTIRGRTISGSYRNLLDGKAIEITRKYLMLPGSCYLLELMEE